MSPTPLEQELKAIQTSIAYCRQEYEKQENIHVKEKIQKYKTELEKEEKRILTELTK